MFLFLHKNTSAGLPPPQSGSYMRPWQTKVRRW
uniref:Uncharacterized protein n=1 Tax=Zea mays TaxID=4577 RepID=C4J368_MAIZE|nr:unknown [Zea mays]ACR37203.1 unknown [Zea mays]